MSNNEQLTLLAERINSNVNLADKRILEIGCGNGDLSRFIAGHYSIKHITGIDPMLSEWWCAGESFGESWSIIDGDVEHLYFDDNCFDTVISFSTFEHIRNIDKALSEIKRVLKPYGRFYTEISPIWTSVVGPHFVAPDDLKRNKEQLLHITPRGHVYKDEFQMRDHLHRQTDDDTLISQILHFIYHIDIINRLSRRSLIDAILNCGMLVRMYNETVVFNRLAIMEVKKTSELTADILEKVVSAGYDAADIGVLSMTACLEKYKSL